MESKTDASHSISRTELIRGMIQKPMVRLFTGENFTGDFKDYHFGKKSNYKGCYHFDESLEIKSGATFGSVHKLRHVL
ncbi:unnamed protein product, partial [Allacma fusca]